MSTWIALCLIVSFALALCAKPTAFLHPVLTWHRVVRGHTWDLVPVGFADWDIVCSCGKTGEL